MPHGNVARVGYSLGSFLSNDGLLELEDLTTFPFLMLDLFLGGGQTMGLG